MPAPLRNRNGQKTWLREPISDQNEKTEVVKSRIVESQRKLLKSLLNEGETESAFIRDAIADALKKRLQENESATN